MKQLLAFPYTEGLVYLLSLGGLCALKAECLALAYAEADCGTMAGTMLLFALLAAIPAGAVLLIRLQIFDIAYCLYIFDIDCP